MTKPTPTAIVIFLLLLSATYLQTKEGMKTWNLAFAPVEYRCNGDKQAPNNAPLFKRAFLPTDPSAPAVHAATMVELKNGDLLAAWFGGSKEGALDVNIHSAIFDSREARWRASGVIANRVRTGIELDRYIRKIGNPVLMMDARSRIWLFYVTVSIGGWSGSSITFRISDDQGKSWSPARRLITSPLINISTLVKGRPVLFDNGLIGLPIYHEQFGEFAEFLIIDEQGRVLDKRRITHGKTAIQPWLIPTDKHRAIALMRTTGNNVRNVLYSQTPDNGMHWSKWKATNLSNPSAAISAAITTSCRYLLVFNNQEENRDNLSMAISENGLEWKPISTLEQNKDSNEEYSYPYLLHTDSGEYHLLYTWRRKKIAHILFNEAWLKRQSGKAE